MPMIWNTHLLPSSNIPQYDATHSNMNFTISSRSSNSDNGMPLLESVSELQLHDFPQEEEIRVIPVEATGILRFMDDQNTRSSVLVWEMNTLMNPSYEKHWFDFAASVLLALHTYIPFNVPRSLFPLNVTLVWSTTPQGDHFSDERTPYCIYFHVNSSNYCNVDLHMAALSYALATCYVKISVVLAKTSFGSIFRDTVLHCSGVDRRNSPSYFMLGTHCVTKPHAAERPDMNEVHQAIEESLSAAEHVHLV
ncbi:hypothetical protein CONPUDRAFT_73879 [Coniophora puteana RWD-64-598 SS2]|uniref:Uncharacterized protein n=1 Tax=Coniophora puteana (strain RWD-64-598) TaxID=741705 RepID=A0A5M3MP95_CONPW|nr:uncharacterized protein CONPUDRAFT_73879 [Coniophora puteana RWD-64-598 SS2]EIW80867.1 hypothetical protein CONPUDRAFT_73879 [Coniophora puteana RWD-64-598 SS2]